MTELNFDRLRKMMETAGHPTTPEPEALTAVRIARNLLDKAGMSFADLSVEEPFDPYSEAGHRLRVERRMASLERLRDEKDARIAQLQATVREQEAARIEWEKRERQQVRTITKQDKIITKQAARFERMKIKIGAQAKEIKALRTEREALRREKTVRKPAKGASPATHAARAALSSAAGIDGVIAVLRVLYEIDSGMRIKTGLALAITAANDGIPINQLAEQVGETTPASMRYTMRALGQGWPGGRAGHGLVMECANSNGERARLHVVTPKGRAVCDALRAAFNGSGVKPRPEIKLAA